MSGNVRHVIPSGDAIEHDTSGGDAHCDDLEATLQRHAPHQKRLRTADCVFEHPRMDDGPRTSGGDDQ